jgi:hypothetical protein
MNCRSLEGTLIERELVKILCEPEAVSAGLKRTNGLLKGLFVIFADAHHLADSSHLRAELVLDAFELLKSQKPTWRT